MHDSGRRRALTFAMATLLLGGGAVAAGQALPSRPTPHAIGPIRISTVPVDPALTVLSATYTPSGKVLLAYHDQAGQDHRYVKLAVMDDDGRNFRPFFAQQIPARPKDNGLRYMVFADNKRIFLGDFILECAPGIDDCRNAALLPVEYPAEVADSNVVTNRWSEIIVAPDNRHIAWTTLLAGSAVVYVGALQRTAAGYTVVGAQIVSSLDPFRKDPNHADGVLPEPIRGGEVKQFVDGGAAISMAGAVRRDTPDSVVQHLVTGRKEAITDTPGYTETTIVSPDGRLGLTMTTRFSDRTDPAILGLVPRPYPDSLNMGLAMYAYLYSVTGVRQAREGHVGPALIDIAASKSRPGYLGANLATGDGWVFRSPMSWRPDSRKAMWIEVQRGSGAVRIRTVALPGYRPGPAVTMHPTPDRIAYGVSDPAAVARYVAANATLDLKVYGRKTGYITYRRTPDGVTEKTYTGFSDDGRTTWSGSERMVANPAGRSTYTAKVTLAGATPGAMDLQITFGPLRAALPAQIIFAADADGVPLSHGHADFGGRHLDVATLLP